MEANDEEELKSKAAILESGRVIQFLEMPRQADMALRKCNWSHHCLSRTLGMLRSLAGFFCEPIFKPFGYFH